MAPATLFRRHDPASHAKYQDLKSLARAQARILAGTPGTLKKRTQGGRQYWVREYIRADGKKTDEYLGAVDSMAPKALQEIRDALDIAKALAAGSSTLRLFGYQRIDRKPAAVLEALHNQGLLQAGLVLVGSHAYGALLNELGLIAPGYKTQDIDLARGRPLKVALPADASFQTVLAESGLRFVPVPGMPSHAPSASFKIPGADTLAVDLLVPGNKTGQILAVDELKAHGQAIPHLAFLLEEAIETVVLSPNQVIPVRVPAPERYLVHKMFSSQSRRTNDRDKVRKDLEQAAVLAVAMEDENPGRLAETAAQFPAAGRAAMKQGCKAVSHLLEGRYPDVQTVLLKVAGRK